MLMLVYNDSSKALLCVCVCVCACVCVRVVLPVDQSCVVKCVISQCVMCPNVGRNMFIIPLCYSHIPLHWCVFSTSVALAG